MTRIVGSVARDGSIRMVVYPPVQCGACKRMASFLVNRHGNTTCSTCAEGK